MTSSIDLWTAVLKPGFDCRHLYCLETGCERDLSRRWSGDIFGKYNLFGYANVTLRNPA